MQRNVRENLRKGEILVRKCLEFAFGTFDTWQFNLQGMGGNPFDSPLGGGQMFSPDVFSKLNGNGFGMGAEEFGLISADQLKVTRMTHGTLWPLLQAPSPKRGRLQSTVACVQTSCYMASCKSWRFVDVLTGFMTLFFCKEQIRFWHFAVES